MKQKSDFTPTNVAFTFNLTTIGQAARLKGNTKLYNPQKRIIKSIVSAVRTKSWNLNKVSKSTFSIGH